jgi:hypothetical protein
MSKTLYYPVYIAPGRKTGGWTWGKPCDTLVEAGRWLNDEMESIGSPMGLIVEFANGQKTPMVDHIRPESAKKVVRHWEKLWEITEETDGS